MPQCIVVHSHRFSFDWRVLAEIRFVNAVWLGQGTQTDAMMRICTIVSVPVSRGFGCLRVEYIYIYIYIYVYEYIYIYIYMYL